MSKAPPNKTAPEVLADTGRAIFDGEDWQKRLADELGVRRDTIRFWLNGRMRFEPDHLALVRLLEVANRRAEEVAKARDELPGWLEKNRR